MSFLFHAVGEAVGGGYEGARREQAQADRRQAGYREHREDHDPPCALQQSDLAVDTQAFGAGAGVRGKERERHRETGEQSFVGAGRAGVEEDQADEDRRLREPVQGRVEKGAEGAHPFRLAGDGSIERVEEPPQEHHRTGDPGVSQAEEYRGKERQGPADNRERVGANPHDREPPDEWMQDEKERVLRSLSEGGFPGFAVRDSHLSSSLRSPPAPSLAAGVPASGSSTGLTGGFPQRSKIRVPRR